MPVSAKVAERQLLRDGAYVALRDAIVAGTLAPGERLHDGELCAWLHLSRTPVRDALARLQDEGLIQTAPQRFTRVTQLTPQDVHDSFPLLAAIHALAAELAVPRLTGEDLSELRAANEAFVTAIDNGDAPATYAADDGFHMVFVRVCDNADIVTALERMDARLQRLEHLHTGLLPGYRSAAQHELILACAAAGDTTGTAGATRENWLTRGELAKQTLRTAEVAPANRLTRTA